MSNLIQFPETSHVYTHSNVQLDKDRGAAILSMDPHPRPSFTPELLGDMKAFQDEVARRVRLALDEDRAPEIRYTVLASDMDGIFNFGGDLNRFVELIRAGDGEGLLKYAMDCVEIVHAYSVGYDLPVTTIALVEGRAQGGGLESALSCNILIAEKGTQLGLPEVLFNLFPGMGAYSFLSRKIGSSLAERMILSGRLYEAEELYDMGVVDVLAEAGEGRERLNAFLEESDKRNSAHRLIHRVHSTHNRVPFAELKDITELWVESALRLSDKELRTMERLVRAQNRRISQEERQAN
ncbi:MAG TPA: crotonase/enoyl-CoA hydratase family protein [Gammaproteobacteria bacterium]|nr:crotonase/enoyl-CoA hydratase family protein [Gammaproteobacteria bacterium]